MFGDIIFIIVILLAVAVIVLAVWLIVLDRRIRRLTRGGNASLEQTLGAYMDRTDTLTEWCQKLDTHNEMRDEQFNASIKGIGFVRFNPYEDAGPQQSFALALLNNHHDGVVLSSISARDKMRVFVKKINNLSPDQELTNEEQQALADAQSTIKKLTQS